MTQSLNKSSRALVLDLINADNSQNFAESDFIWGSPVAITGRSDGRNTALVISARPELGYAGTQTMFYNRLDLTQLFNEVTLSFEDNPDAYTNTSDIVELINSKYDLAMDESDVVFESLMREGDAPYTFTLTAKSGSYAYIGQVEFTLTELIVDPPEDTAYLTDGFFFVNMTDGKIGASIESLTDVSDPEVPLIPQPDTQNLTNAILMASGGYENEIFALTQAITLDENDTPSYTLQLHVSKDKGISWSVQDPEDLVSMSMSNNGVGGGALVFKGVLYFIATTTDGMMAGFSGPGLYRAVPSESSDYIFERVLDDCLILAATEELLFASSYTHMNVSSDGVTWTRETTPELTSFGLLSGIHQDQLVGFGISSSGLAFYRRTAEGSYVALPFTLFADRPGAMIVKGVIFSVDDKLVAVLNMSDGTNHWIGDVIQSENGGDNWVVKHALTGMQLVTPPADDGTTVIAIGQVDPDTTSGTTRMLVSTDRASTWNLYDADSFPFLVDNTAPAAVVVRRNHKGTRPAITPSAPPSPNYIQDYPSQVDIAPGTISVLSDNRIVLSGAMLSFGQYISEVDHQALNNNGLAVLNEDGTLIDLPALGLTTVLTAVVTPNDQILVAHGYNDTQLSRLNSDLTLDDSFTPAPVQRISNHLFPAIRRLYVQEDGKILIIGDFNSVDGNTRYGLARLNEDGSFDASFATPFVSPIASQFANYGSSHFGGARLLPSGRILVQDPQASPSGVFLVDENGDRIPSLEIDDVQINDVHEYSNGDLLLSLDSTSNAVNNKRLVKWLNNGTIVTDLECADLSTRALLDIGGDRVMAQYADPDSMGERRIVAIAADGTIDDQWTTVAQTINGPIQYSVRQSNGAIVAVFLNSGVFRQSEYPLQNKRAANRIIRFIPNQWSMSASITVDQPIGDDFTDGNGELQTGAPTDDGNFVVLNHPFLTMGLRAFADNDNSIDPTAGYYDFTTAVKDGSAADGFGGTWGLQFAVDVGGGKLLTDAGITLKCNYLGLEETLVYQSTPSPRFWHEALAVAIPVVFENVDGTQLQGTVASSALAALWPNDAVLNTDGALLGNLTFTLTATSFVDMPTASITISLETGAEGSDWVDPAPEGVTTSYNVELTDPDLLDENSGLRAQEPAYGSGGPTSSYYQQESADFLVALVPYSDWDWPVDTEENDGVYKLNVYTNEDPAWSVAFVAKDKTGGTVLDDYDFKLSFRDTSMADPAFVLDLVNDGGTWALENSSAGISLPVGYAEGSVVESVIPMNEIAGHITANLSDGYDMSEGVFTETEGMAFPLGNFEIILQLIRKSDSTLAANCVITVQAPGAISYPLNEYDVTLGSEYLDGNSKMLFDANAVDGHWMKSEGRAVTAALRAAVESSDPETPIYEEDFESANDLYPLVTSPNDNNQWFFDVVIKTHTADAVVDTYGTSLNIEVYDPSNGSSDSAFLYQLGMYSNGGSEVLALIDDMSNGPVLYPSYESPDGSHLQFHIDMAALADSVPSGLLTTEGKMLGDFITWLELSELNPTDPDMEDFVECAVWAQVTEALPILTEVEISGIGRAGYAYIIAPSALLTLTEGMFEHTQHANHIHVAKIIDDTLYFEINFDSVGMGFSSDYSGTLEDVTLYGCDPDTGDVVSTQVLAASITWDNSNNEYALSPIGPLDSNLAWKASVHVSLTSNDGNDDPVDWNVNMTYLKSQTVEVITVDSVAINQTLSAHDGVTSNSLTRAVPSSAVVYGTLNGLSVGSHQAVIEINGVEHTVDFEVEPGI